MTESRFRLYAAQFGPALTGQPNWAADWASSAMALLETLKPMSAGAQLLSQVLQVSLDDRGAGPAADDPCDTGRLHEAR